MHGDFYPLADFIDQQLHAGEVCLTKFSGEQSDFIRFNRAKVRQPSHVEQRYVELDLIAGQRHVKGQLSLSGEPQTDQKRVHALIVELRDQPQCKPGATHHADSER